MAEGMQSITRETKKALVLIGKWLQVLVTKMQPNWLETNATKPTSL